MEGLELLFAKALKLELPWMVTKVEFDEGGGVIKVFIDFPRGSVFFCPTCGKPVKAYDTTEKEWRHLSFFQYACYLVVRVPRIDCPDDGILQIEVPWIIGPNGAGKTTFFNVLTGMLTPTDGDILFKGKSIAGFPPHQVAHQGIGRSFQITSIFPELTVLENILIPAMLYYRPKPEALRKAWEILEDVDLKDKANLVAANLSHGDKRHLDIGIALTTKPELLLLDEPTSGMPPKRVSAPSS